MRDDADPEGSVASCGQEERDNPIDPEQNSHLPPPSASNECDQLQRLADQHFKEFIDHRSVDRYEAQMKAAYSSVLPAKINKYVDIIRVWVVSRGAPPYEAYSDFLRGILPLDSSTSPPPGSYVRPQNEVAIEHFEEFLHNHSIDQYEARMKAHYSSEYTAIIDEHVKDLRAWTDTNLSSAPNGALHAFIGALTTIRGKEGC